MVRGTDFDNWLILTTCDLWVKKSKMLKPSSLLSAQSALQTGHNQTHSDTPIVEATMQGADLLIKSILDFGSLLKNTLICSKGSWGTESVIWITQ